MREYAVAVTGDNFSDMFAGMEDEYFKARAIDVKDISERVISILGGRSDRQEEGEEPAIIVAEDLTPSETVQMDKDKILAFATKLGSSKLPHRNPCKDDEYSGVDRRCHR